VSRLFLFAGVFTSVALAAPVPKGKGKVDPGEPWTFPDLESKGWVDLKDGLKVWDVKEGDGEPVTAGATVKVHYTGWLTDGKQFDSSRNGGREPLQFGLKQLVKGWQEGVPGMKPGGIRRLLVPPEMGYGARGAPPAIPENATLVFVIELLPNEKK
jgi:FKBP-type peptidyl-prolyl cis-trans isomerase